MLREGDMTVAEGESVSLSLTGAMISTILRGLHAGRYDEVKGAIDQINADLTAHVARRNEVIRLVNERAAAPVAEPPVLTEAVPEAPAAA